jgi:hypothetical protein
VITGYNTDVRHNNRVFHIQTEDKGEDNPYIESLVYVGGEILATRRTSYGEVLEEPRDDRAIQELMEQQHRTMIAAIQRGRFDGPDGTLRVPEEDTASKAAVSEEMERTLVAPEGDGKDAPAPAPAAATPGPTGDRTLDQVILDYLASEMDQEEIEVLLTAPELRAGKSANLRMRVETAQTRQPVAGASVQIRVLSTVARPSLVFQGKTSGDGSCAASFSVPALSTGSALCVVRVSSPGASTELKYPVRVP